MDRILFNSRDPQHKTPFGTVRTGDCCVLRLLTPHVSGATGVTLMLEDCDEQPLRELPFVPESEDADVRWWRCEFSLPRGLYFYWFRVEKVGGSFRLFRQGEQTNMESGEKWQLSFVPADHTIPDFACGAVMYQIMPDRFWQSGECDLSEKLRPFSVHASHAEQPCYTADAGGNWCGDFYGGNLRGIQEKLPYLRELGVGILYLNPVFMAYSNHRYDTADYKRVDPMLGTEDDFRALCDAAHENGMRVILDGVFSHTGSNSVYFDAKHIFGHGAVSDPASPYREWYHFRHYPDSYDCWWNMPTLPNVEELTPSYVNYIIEDEDSVIAHWLRLGADGYRLDVVDELPDEFVAKLKRRMRAVKPESILLGEVWEDASNKRAYGVSRRYFVDAELDSVMNYPWRKAILAFAKGEDDGTGFGEAVMTIAEHYPPQVLNSVMNLLGSHDTTRLLTELSGVQANSREEKAAVRLTEEQRRLAIERERLAAFLQFTLPGIPSIYYGDEVGMEGFDDPFCRAFYDWENGDEALRAYYLGLSRLRNESEALRRGTVRVLEAGRGRIAFLRETAEQKATVFVNCTDKSWQLPDGYARFGCTMCVDREKNTLLPGGFCVLFSQKSAE